MSLPATTAHCNQSAGEHGVLRAADLDVWVAYDGGVVTLRPGTSENGGSDDAGTGTPGAVDSPSSVETDSITASVATTGTGASDRSPTEEFTSSTTLIPTQSSMELLTITPSTNLPTLMSETQAPSSVSLMATPEIGSVTTSNIMTPSLPPEILSMPSSPSSLSPSSTAVSTGPDSTFTASAVPTSADYLSHSPPYYVAIVLGTIAGVAVLASLIAWAVRRQAHERRRRLVDSAAKLPWVYSTGGNDDDDGLGDPSTTSDLENAMRTTTTEMGIINLGSREDMAYVQSWEPRGDRDVGEPKRSEYYMDRKPRPPFINQHIPSYALFSRYSGQQFIGNPVASSCANRLSLGSIDPRLQLDTLGKGSALLITNQVPGDISVSSSQEAGFTCPSRGSMSPLPEIGTPRELVPMPRFLGLDGKGLVIPWEEKDISSSEDSPASKTKSRIMSAEHIRKTWERQAPNHPGSPSNLASHSGDALEGEGWTNSIKSNFVNAFNAVAASLPIAAIRDGKENSESIFTPARPKRSFKRDTPRRSSPAQDEVNSKQTLSRGCTTKTSASDLWSLIATGSTTGVVHIRLPTSDVCSVSSHNLSDPAFGLSRSYTLQSAEPLQVKKKTSTTFSRSRPSISSKDSRVRAPFSRGSSVGGSVSPKRHRKAPGGSMKRKITLDRRSGPLFSRTTSMASSSSTISTVSIVTGTEDIKEKRLLAREALKDRRIKAKRLKEISIG